MTLTVTFCNTDCHSKMHLQCSIDHHQYIVGKTQTCFRNIQKYLERFPLISEDVKKGLSKPCHKYPPIVSPTNEMRLSHLNTSLAFIAWNVNKLALQKLSYRNDRCLPRPLPKRRLINTINPRNTAQSGGPVHPECYRREPFTLRVATDATHQNVYQKLSALFTVVVAAR